MIDLIIKGYKLNYRSYFHIYIFLLLILLTACNNGSYETYEKPEPLISVYQLSVIKTGTGLIKSSDALIDCGENCENTYDQISSITLTAYEDEGSLFTGWSGACSGSAPCTLMINGIKTVRANFEPIELEQAIRVEGLTVHVEMFAELAWENEGHRAVGSSGYKACANYVHTVLTEANQVRQLFGKPGLTVTTQDIMIRHFEIEETPLLERVLPVPAIFTVNHDFIAMRLSGSGDLTGEIAFINPMMPPGAEPNTSADGCQPEDFEGIDLMGKIAVIQRGTCFFREKAWNAQLNGAAAVIIFNEGQNERTAVMYGDLGDISEVTVPVIGISYQLAETLHELTQNSNVVLRLSVSSVDELRLAQNILAETAFGNPDQIIMIGARLSSPPTGPGVNDNATGAAAVLELANQLTRKGFEFTNRLRFAWWADDEYLLGSRRYADMLEFEQAEKIALYLNADTIGSINYILGVYDGDLSDTATDMDSIADHPQYLPFGTTEIEHTFINWFQAQGFDPVPIPMYGDSAYYPLMFLNIPFGGLFTGTHNLKTLEQYSLFGGIANAPYDPCRSQPCDDIYNYHPEALKLNAAAIAYAARYYASQEILFSETNSRSTASLMKHRSISAPKSRNYRLSEIKFQKDKRGR